MDYICNKYRYLYSLRRSRVRFDILVALAKIYPNYLPPSEISRVTGHYQSDILGALIGNTKYSKENSLVEIGLVEVIVDKNKRYYKATQLGLDCLKTINEI